MPQTLSPLAADIAPASHFTPYATNDDRAAVRVWAAHVAAGRIGSHTPTPPEVAASRDRAAALFAGYARDARRLRREPLL